MDPTRGSKKPDYSGDGTRGSMGHIDDPVKLHPSITSTSQYVACALQAVRDTFAKKHCSAAGQDSDKPVVAMVLSAEGGYGDILFTYKAALGLCTKGCKVEVDLLDGPLKSAEEVKKIMEEMPESHRLNIRVPTDSREGAAKPDCVIVSPTRPEYSEVVSKFPHLEGLPSEYVREYGTFKKGYQDEDDYEVLEDLFDYETSAGVGPGQLGIFAEGGLKEPLTPQQKVDKFTDLCDSDPAKYASILNGKSPDEYLETNKLFFGYAHKEDYIERFVEAVVILEEGSECDCIDIVVPWRKNDTKASEFNKQCFYYEEALAKSGISRVEVIDENGTTVEEFANRGAGKVLRIINIFPVPNKSFKQLLEVSEDLSLITGDQSWNESVLLPDKTILYEKHDWKRDFYDSTRSIAKQEPMVASVMDAWDQRKPTIEVAAAVRILNAENKKSLKAGEGSPTRRYHAQVVSKENSLVDNLYKEAVRLSACSKTPQLRSELDGMEKMVKERFHASLIIDKGAETLFNALEGWVIRLDIYLNHGTIEEYMETDLPDLEILNKYQSWWTEADKGSLPEEKVAVMQKGFDFFGQIKDKKSVDVEEINRLLDSAETIDKGVLPSYQKAFEQAQKDF